MERENNELNTQWLETAITYKVKWERELERRRRLGIEAPDPIPHPDHLVIDMRTGTVRITGPMTPEEKELWDLLKDDAPESKRFLAELDTLMTRRPDLAIVEGYSLLKHPAEPGLSMIKRIIVDPADRKRDGAKDEG